MEPHDFFPIVRLGRSILNALSGETFPIQIQTNNLQIVTSGFSKNARRLASLATFPALIVEDTLLRVSIIEGATREAEGEAPAGTKPTQELINSKIAKWNELKDRNLLVVAPKCFKGAEQITEELTPDQAMSMHLNALTYRDDAREAVDGTESLFSSLLVGAWTTFETLAGDLWEASIDSAPAKLAQDAHGINWGDVRSVTRGTFILDGRIGKLMRLGLKKKFDSLDGIRAAYNSVFREHGDRINELTHDPVLAALSAARNVIVHNGGIMDAKYKDDFAAAKAPILPAPKIGEPFPIKGQIVHDLILPVVNVCSALILAVDRWLVLHAK